MATPDLVDQLTAGGEFPHEDCGESCVASILFDAGRMSSVFDIERFDLNHGDNPADGTGGAVHVARLAKAGIAAHTWSADTRTTVRAAFAHGLNRCMVAIFSDHAGNPSPGSGIGHWVLCYGYDPGADVFSVMQPVGGRLVRYSGGSMVAAQQRFGILVDQPVGAGDSAQRVNNIAIVTAPQTIQGGEENMVRTPIAIPTDSSGAGFAQTAIPWATFVAAVHNGADPRTDGIHFPGEVHASQRDQGNVLVDITRARPNTTEIVFVVSTQ
jgi:hypothetical protein